MTLRRALLIVVLAVVVFLPPAFLLFGANAPTGSRSLSGFAAEGLASTEGGRLALAAWWVFVFGLVALVILKRGRKRSNSTQHRTRA